MFSLRTSAPLQFELFWQIDVYHINEFSSSSEGYKKSCYDASCRKLECKEDGLSDIIKSSGIRSVLLWFLTPRSFRALPVPLASFPPCGVNFWDLFLLRCLNLPPDKRQCCGRYTLEHFARFLENSFLNCLLVTACTGLQVRVLHTLICCFFLLCLFEANLSSVPLTSEADIYTRHLTIQFTQLILLTFLLSISRGVPLDVQRAPNSVGFTNYITHAHLNDL